MMQIWSEDIWKLRKGSWTLVWSFSQATWARTVGVVLQKCLRIFWRSKCTAEETLRCPFTIYYYTRNLNIHKKLKVHFLGCRVCDKDQKWDGSAYRGSIFRNRLSLCSRGARAEREIEHFFDDQSFWGVCYVLPYRTPVSPAHFVFVFVFIFYNCICLYHGCLAFFYPYSYSICLRIFIKNLWNWKILLEYTLQGTSLWEGFSL